MVGAPSYTCTAAHDSLHFLLQKGREGVELEYEQTPEFHEAWKLKSRDMIAQAEWRRRKLGKRASLVHHHLLMLLDLPWSIVIMACS